MVQRNARFAVLVVLAGSGLAGCTDDKVPDPPRATPGTVITITTTVPLALVVFRDGIDARWQSATQKRPDLYEATVHGPYILAVVCDYTVLGSSGVTTWRAGRTLDEPHEVTVPCSKVTRHTVTARMVQDGYLSLIHIS